MNPTSLAEKPVAIERKVRARDLPPVRRSVWPPSTRVPILSALAGPRSTRVPIFSALVGPRSTRVPVFSALAGPRSTRVPILSALVGPRSTRVPILSALAGPRSTRVPILSALVGPRSTRVPIFSALAGPRSTRIPIFSVLVGTRSTRVPILLLALALAFPLSAQEALRLSLAGEAASASLRSQQQNQAYSLKSGDFKLLIEPSLGIDWLDDIYLSDQDKESDVIISPMLRLNASYPLTDVNTLNVSVAVGYDFYVDHDDWSVFRLEPGSELSYDIFIKDLRINVHDRFSYVQDPAQEAAVANTVRYGGFYDTAGVTGIWDLKDVVITLGYDHYTFVSTTSDYEYLDRGTELPVGRAGYQFSDAVTAGVEATGSFNRYDDPVLNNSTGYSAGAYAEWQVSEYIQVRPRAGYASYFFDQTSLVLPAEDQDAWYADLTLQHRVNEAVSYNLSAGHELRLGINSDAIESTYARLGINWRIIKDVSVNTSAGYENGKQPGGLVEEDYDHFSAGFSVGYHLMEKMRASLNYRWTLRSSDVDGRDYTQNRVGLQLAYRF